MSEKRRYAIVIEGGEPGSNYSAFVPDLPGCMTTGKTVQEIKRNMVEAIELHLFGLHRDGDAIPQPSAISDYVEVLDDPGVWREGVIVSE